MNKFARLLSLIWITFALGVSTSLAADHPPGETKTAILLANFGTTVPSAIPAIINIRDQIKKAYPATEVRLTFTSNIIRSVWKKRRAEAQKWLDQGVPSEVLYAPNIITAMGELQEDGYRNIIVQPTHMFFMEQTHDLQAHIGALASINTIKKKWRPFDAVVMGRPALGMPGDTHDYHDDIAAVVKILAGHVDRARKEGAILLYMGHGNEHWSTGIYAETEKKMREVYPDVATFIGTVEGTPSLSDLLVRIEQEKSKKVLLLPFMIVAGDHAQNDMAGPEEDSWKSILTAKGYTVTPVLEGLGADDGFAGLFVDHIADAARARGLSLK